MFLEKSARLFFRFGSGIFCFPRQNETFLEPRFSACDVAIFADVKGDVKKRCRA
nr:hypothetical protein [Porphyromonas gulae]